MKKPVVPDLKKDWNDIFKTMKKKNLEIPDIEIGKQVKTHRKKDQQSNGMMSSEDSS